MDRINKKATTDFKIPWAKPFLGQKEKEYLADAIDSTWISSGPYIDRFEEEFLRRIGAPHGLVTSSGTGALQLAVRALGLSTGDEVIVPAFSFAAPVNAVLNVGATPVYADIDPQTWCMDPVSVVRQITSKTKAIIAVHLYGNVCDMRAIEALAREYGIKVIEDTAEAAFSKMNGQYAGTFSDIGCFSFQATKTLTMGEGGFVVSSQGRLVDSMRLMRDHGMRQGKQYWHDTLGCNFRATNLQAAVGCAQLERVDEMIARRRQVYQWYCDRLGKMKGVFMQKFSLGCEPVVWALAVRCDQNFFQGDRDWIIKQFAKEGIETRPGFFTFHDMPFYGAPAMSVAQDVARNIIALPFFAAMTFEEVEYVCASLERLRK